MKNEATNRKLKISILRFNPREPGNEPRMVTYELDEAENMTLFIALNEIREKQEPSLEFDFVCRAGICGSCGMMINGRPTLACRTLTRDLDAEISLAPLPVFELIADLSVDTGKWMRGMASTASVALLQRRLRVGYARAGRLVDIMEQMGVISGYDGSKARGVLIGEEDLPGVLAQIAGQELPPADAGAPSVLPPDEAADEPA